MRQSRERDGEIKNFIDKRNANIELAGNVDGLFLNDFAPSSSDGSDEIFTRTSKPLDCGNHHRQQQRILPRDQLFAA